MSTIVVAVLVVIVLVILSVLLVRSLGIVGTEANQCSERGGKCVAVVQTDTTCSEAEDAGDGWTRYRFGDQECKQRRGEDYGCCIPVTN